MKMKINKACDLSAISVLPPHARRSSDVPTGLQASQQLRSQASQQSLSQGLSSQHGMFSQFSQDSFSETVTNDQRLGSQERENSKRRLSCFAPINYAREESQMAISRSSTKPMQRWNSASVPEHRCRVSEELEYRIGMIETTVTRFGMILDSVQGDVMQINKATKEVSMELEGMRQRLTLNDNLLQLMSKGLEDIKDSLEGKLKSISDGLCKISYQERLQEIFSKLSALPERIEALLLKSQNDLCSAFIKEMQAKSSSLKDYNQKYKEPHFPPQKGLGCPITLQKTTPPCKISDVPPKEGVQATFVPKIEVGCWNSVKKDRAAVTARNPIMKTERKEFSPIQQEKEWRVIIESDEEIDRSFSCLIEEKETGNYLIDDVREETDRILRKARRRKRKSCSAILIS
ncbi:putative recombination initiation defects 3 [Malania oleifera]|uniref:putative recombination initiation defects 3 n=1 Tax=Malania oleifera TaxID=397392 RepID=UPI0025ADE217|nr:putative recombination initiation defects 3 [Malania oleifera]XP_057981410.1 putative recombination initiation defects 3 [Malania oleifera]XP_057981411.1 putative recombination initiation defects 3 [Malania oleifera]